MYHYGQYKWPKCTNYELCSGLSNPLMLKHVGFAEKVNLLGESCIFMRPKKK